MANNNSLTTSGHYNYIGLTSIASVLKNNVTFWMTIYWSCNSSIWCLIQKFRTHECLSISLSSQTGINLQSANKGTISHKWCQPTPAHTRGTSRLHSGTSLNKGTSLHKDTRSHVHNLQTSKAPLEGLTQAITLFTIVPVYTQEYYHPR